MASNERSRAKERQSWDPQERISYDKFAKWFEEVGVLPATTIQQVIDEWAKLQGLATGHALVLVLSKGRNDRMEKQRVIKSLEECETKLESKEMSVRQLEFELNRLKEAKTEADAASSLDGGGTSRDTIIPGRVHQLENELAARNDEVQQLKNEVAELRARLGQLEDLQNRLDEYEHAFTALEAEKSDARKKVEELQGIVAALQNENVSKTEVTTPANGGDVITTGEWGAATKPEGASKARKSIIEQEKELKTYIVPELKETFTLRCQFQTDQLKQRRDRFEKVKKKPVIKYTSKPPGKPADCKDYKDIVITKFTRANCDTYPWMQHVEQLESWFDADLEEKEFVKIWALKRSVGPEVLKFINDLGIPINYNYEMIVDRVRSEFGKLKLPSDLMREWMEARQGDNEGIAAFSRRFLDIERQMSVGAPGYCAWEDAALKCNFIYRVRGPLFEKAKSLNPTMEYDAGVGFDNMLRYMEHAEEVLASEEAKREVKQDKRDKPPVEEREVSAGRLRGPRKSCTYCGGTSHTEDTCRTKMKALEEGLVKQGVSNPEKVKPSEPKKQEETGRRGPPPYQRAPGEPFRGKCFNCGETGHYSKACPKPFNRNNPRNPIVQVRSLQEKVQKQQELLANMQAGNHDYQPGYMSPSNGNGQQYHQQQLHQQQQWNDGTQAPYMMMQPNGLYTPGQNPTARPYSAQGVNDFVEAKAFGRMLVKDSTKAQQWYQMVTPPSSSGFIRQANMRGTGTEMNEIVCTLEEIGDDPRELKLEVLNGRIPGKTVPWNKTWNRLKDCEQCKTQEIIDGLLAISNKAQTECPEHAARAKRLREMAGEAIDNFVCTGALTIGSQFILDVLHDTGAQINAMSLKAFWSLIGRDPEIQKCCNSLDFTPNFKHEVFTSAGGVHVPIFCNALLPVRAGDRDLEMVFAIHDDTSCIIMLGTPGMRRLGFQLTAPHLGEVDLIDPASTCNGWREVRKDELASIRAAGVKLGKTQFIGQEMQDRIDQAGWKENASKNEMLHFMAAQASMERGYFDEDTIDKRSEWKHRASQESAQATDETPPEVLTINSSSDIGLSPIPPALGEAVEGSAGHTPYPQATKESKAKGDTPVVLPGRLKTRDDTPAGIALGMRMIVPRQSIDDDVVDLTPITGQRKSRVGEEGKSDSVKRAEKFDKLLNAQKEMTDEMKKLMESVKANADAIGQLKAASVRPRMESQSVQVAEARAVTARKPELTEMPRLVPEGQSDADAQDGGAEKKGSRGSRKSSRTETAFAATSGTSDDGQPQRKMSKTDETFVVPRSRSTSGSSRKRSSTVFTLQKAAPKTRAKTTKSESDGVRKTSTLSTIAQVFRRSTGNRLIDGPVASNDEDRANTADQGTTPATE